MWNIVYSSEFEQWFFSLNEDEQDSVLYSLNVLKQIGPQLGRPHVDTIQGTELCNLKELRIQHQGYPYRAFFVFDPKRQAVVLCAGNKTGNANLFYKTMVTIAIQIYKRYLQEIE